MKFVRGRFQIDIISILAHVYLLLQPLAFRLLFILNPTLLSELHDHLMFGNVQLRNAKDVRSISDDLAWRLLILHINIVNIHGVSQTSRFFLFEWIYLFIWILLVSIID